MNKTETLKELKAAGTAQNRKVYGRHGVSGPMFGVSYAHLEKLRKRIKVDHELATKLWESGNHDARVLATMVADPDAVTARQLDAWVKQLDNYVVTDAFSKLVARSPLAAARMKAWTKAAGEWKSVAGWNALAGLIDKPGEVSDGDLADLLGIIEKKIHKAPNRTRYAMNTALISIALRSAALEKKALAAARRIGPVEVDHGETGCKTPDAVTYIPKAAAHHRAKKAKARKKKAARA